MSTLYAIREDLEAIASMLAEVGGDVTDADAEAAIDAWLTETTEARDEKLDRYCALIREMEERAESRKAEAERLDALATTDSNAAKRLKARLQWFLEDQGLEKVETPRFRLSLVNNGGKLPLQILCSPESLPAPYRVEVTTVKANQDAIREALEKGEALEFAMLGPRGRNVRIR